MMIVMPKTVAVIRTKDEEYPFFNALPVCVVLGRAPNIQDAEFLGMVQHLVNEHRQENRDE